MLIRYKWWDTDGLPAHKAIRGSVEYVFLDAAHGLCDVRDRLGIEYLLERKANYELAYEQYHISFDAQGQQVEVHQTTDTTSDATGVNLPDSSSRTFAGTPPSKRKPGRPRKG